jgi:hypothetical protein
VSGLLNPEELRRLLTLVWQGGKDMVLVGDGLRDHIAALEKERDAALADNAALLSAAREYNAHMDLSEPWSNGDLGVEDASGLNAASARLLAAISDEVPHPGAALLEEVMALRERVQISERAFKQELDAAQTETRNAWAHATAKEAEHRNALVRARNEGLEKVAQALLAKRDSIMRGVKRGTRSGGLEEAASIARAMKEPEE